MEKHAGEIVEMAIRRSDISIAEVARRLSVTRRSVYYWFNKKVLCISVIYKIGQVINIDFSNDFHMPSGNANTSYQLSADADNPVSSDAIFWKNKYIKVLEQYTELLQQQTVMKEDKAA
jgi:plasmid maintenance system antidote protein VapI